MKQLWKHGTSYLLSSLLICLGFTSCENQEDENPQICMYGTPTAHFGVKGKVVNEKGEVLSGIQVVIPNLEFGYVHRPNVILDHYQGTVPVCDTLYTREDGRFTWLSAAFPSDTVRYNFKFREIPAEGNVPLYQPDSLQVTFLKTELKGGDGAWNRGSAEKEIKIVLKEKENE